MAELALEEGVARLEGRVEGFEGRFDSLERRIDALDQKVDRFREELMHELGGRMTALDEKVSRQFVWIVGIQLTVLLAVVGALTGILLRI